MVTAAPGFQELDSTTSSFEFKESSEAESQTGLMKTPEAKQSGPRRLNQSRCARFVIRAWAFEVARFWSFAPKGQP